MPGLVVSHDAFFFLADQAALALWPGDDALDGFFQISLPDLLLVTAGSQDSALIYQVLQVCAYKPGGRAGQHA